jgi:hypothetical protein
MTEKAAIARLWSGFHHLSEDAKDLVLNIAEAVQPHKRPLLDGPIEPASDDICGGKPVSRHSKNV